MGICGGGILGRRSAWIMFMRESSYANSYCPIKTQGYKMQIKTKEIKTSCIGIDF